MKSKVVGLVLALLFVSAFVTAQAPLSRQEAQSYGPSFTIRAQGTLLELFDANGKSKFGKINHDGFDMTYETAGKKTAVSAMGTKISGLREGVVKSDGRSATVSVKTEDDALEITSYFTFNEKANELIIARRIRNISPQHVTLVKIRDYVASTLKAGKVAASIKLSQSGPGSGCDDLLTCPPSPCPGRQCPTQIKGRNYLTLEWKETIKLAPSPQASHPSTLALAVPENEVYIIVHVRLR